MSDREMRERKESTDRKSDELTVRYKGIGIHAVAAAAPYCEKQKTGKTVGQHTSRARYDIEVTD